MFVKNLLVQIAVGVILLIAGRYSLFHLWGWLDVSGHPEKADIIVCLGGNLKRVDKVVSLLRKGYSSRIFITDEDSLRYLKTQQQSYDEVLVPERFPSSTYEEALLFRNYLIGKKVDKVMVVSDAYHMFRVRWTFEHVFSGHSVQFNFVALPQDWKGRSWWEDPEGRVFVCSEVVKVLYYWIGHGLLGIQKDPSWAKKLEPWLDRSLNTLLKW